ncbi:hypothetical protein E2320_014989 [Naja naja]|nr:hypothetical protein E2320_014989 [Naja naja]
MLRSKCKSEIIPFFSSGRCNIPVPYGLYYFHCFDSFVDCCCSAESSCEVLKTGWQPILIAMIISSFGGVILDKTVAKPNFEGIAVFVPVINGVGGNLVAIQASRISTFLHFWSMPGVLPHKMRQHWPNPCTTFFASGINSKSAQVLILLVIPGHLVGILLYMADIIVRLMWRKGLDPDNYSIPYLTALGDLLGTGLAVCFHLLWLLRGLEPKLGN